MTVDRFSLFMDKYTMAPPLTKKQDALMNKLYYDELKTFGRDKMFVYLQSNHPKANISRRQIMEWLKLQPVHQINRVVQKTTIKQTKIPTQKGKTMVIDLTDMVTIQEQGFRWLMTMIDGFSRKAYVEPMNSKSTKDVLAAFNKILKKTGKFSVLRSDNGSEFKSKKFKELCKENNITQIFGEAHRPQSQGLVEKFNGILKENINKTRDILIAKDSDENWTDKLQTLVSNYNDSYQSTIKMTPNEAQQKGTNAIVSKRLKNKQPKLKVKQVLMINDRVRVRLGKLEKESTTERFSRDIYRVVKKKVARKKTTANQYKIKAESKDAKDRSKVWIFESDLLKISPLTNSLDKVNETRFRISDFKGHRVIDGVAYLKTKWVGQTEMTWETRTELKKTASKMVKAYEKTVKNLPWHDDGRIKKVTKNMTKKDVSKPKQTIDRTIESSTRSGRKRKKPVKLTE